MDVGIFTRGADLRDRLRTGVLGRTACAFGHYGSHDGYDRGIHGFVGNHLPANPEADAPPGVGALDRDWGSGDTDDPLVERRRGGNRSGRSGGADHCGDELVGEPCRERGPPGLEALTRSARRKQRDERERGRELRKLASGHAESKDPYHRDALSEHLLFLSRVKVIRSGRVPQVRAPVLGANLSITDFIAS